jgi:hypothetical protein
MKQWANIRYKLYFKYWNLFVAKSKRSKQDEKNALLERKLDLRKIGIVFISIAEMGYHRFVLGKQKMCI